MEQFIINYTAIKIDDLEKVGQKNASIGNLCSIAALSRTHIPSGFAITADAHRYFKAYNNLDEKLAGFISSLDSNDYSSLSYISQQARKLIINSKFPKNLEEEITTAYNTIFPVKDQDVAVRSSLTDTRQVAESYLNISGSIALLYAIKCCFASLYSESSLRYNFENGYQQSEISVGIQQMVRADLACSGIAYTGSNAITIKGSWGLGQNFEANFITPDEFTISKPVLKGNLPYITSKNLGSKSRMLVYNDMAAGTNSTTAKSTPGELREQFILKDAELELLGKKVLEIETQYQANILVEWAKDGITGNLYILQVQPYEPIKLSVSV
jgi:pyruvate,water dikinase